MARTRPGGEPGDKLGPRLAQIMLTYQLAARRALGPLEGRWRQAATQALIDRAGHEVADHWGPLLRPVIAGEHGPVHPLMREHLERASAGTHQWHSLSSLLGMGVQSALSGALSNAVAPVAYEINKLGPNLNADPQVWAAGTAAGYANFGTGQDVAHKNGLGGDNFQLMVDLAAAVPDAGTLAELVNRELLSENEAEQWLHKAAVPERLRAMVMSLRRQLLSPADAALAVLRGVIADDTGRAIAASNGMHGPDFEILLNNTGEPLGLEQLAEALRRGFISRDRFARGLRQSRVRNEWLDVAEELRFSPVATADAIDAWQRGHVNRDQAVTIAEQNGVLPAQVGILLANAGNPPAVEQLLFLLRRGKITREQAITGIRQGRTRDQWIPAVLDLIYQPISTADAIDAWQRGHIDRDQAADIAVQNGTEADQVGILLANAGNPLALEQLLEAYRRKFIDRATLVKGIRQGRTRDDWITTAEQLAHSPMSTADAVEASIQGWLTKAEARNKAEQNGLEPADFEPLWQTAGEPLARTELQELYNRGEISLETYKQGLRESRLKDKYIDDAIHLHVRQPQPREVITAITDGVITRARGLELLRQQGYTAEVAQMLVAEGEVHATGPHRQLVTQQVSVLYADRLISDQQATAYLLQLHYTRPAAAMLLQLADFTREHKILNSGIGVIRSHYLAHRISATVARADLLALRLPSASVDLYMKTWSLDRLASPKQLTEAQIVKAAKNHLFVPKGQLTTGEWDTKNTEAGHERLVQLGYSGDDATLLLNGA